MNQTAFESFVQEYTRKTQSSKLKTQNSRSSLADSRASAGFRMSIKEMLYPIISKTACGSRFMDIDDNEYLDVTMGYGSLLFGHAYPPLTSALTAQLEKGIQIGPQAEKAADVAEQFVRLTGLDRVTFCNSGTEANMIAIRLARLKTGRNKIIIFENSYHGSYDASLVCVGDTIESAKPLYAGLPQSVVSDVIVLPYDDIDALHHIKQYGDTIAAVMVEPVRSRFPESQPTAFLKELRKITQERGIALIFDEIVTGFRCHLLGAQAYFDVRADIVTYGKIIGGGLPIGIIAGAREYLDGIDGGYWEYDNRSFPQNITTYFGGTFFKNALSIEAVHTMLIELQRLGPELQQNLNTKTKHLANDINTYCKNNNIPMEIVYFSSLFRFKFKGNLDLFFYYMIKNGVYIWEGRNCFLSHAHNEQDIQILKDAILQSIDDLKKINFFK